MAASCHDGLPADLEPLPQGWDYLPLSRLIEADRGICYGVVQPGADAETGVPIVRVNNIKEGRIDTHDVLRIAEEIESKYRRSRLRGDEVLLTLVGSLGETAIVPSELAGWNVARAVGVIPVNNEVGPRWIELCLRSATSQRFIQMWATTTVQATLNLRDVANLPIPLPPLQEREIITHVLGTLDDKIELNRRMNETLEASARAIFKSWFVDFDPVRAKAEGRDPGLPKHITDLLPNDFDDSFLGPIPKGWSVLSLDEIARFLNGLALQKYPQTGDSSLPVIKIAQLRAGHTTGADRASTSIPPEYVVDDGDILFSWSGSLECAYWAGGRGALNQHLFKVTSLTYPKWLCYLAVHQHLDSFRHIAAGKATTMGHIQRHHLTQAKVPVPPMPTLHAMSKVLSPILESTWQRSVQSRTLAATRDALLPKLLSGEIRVGEAHQEMEARA